MNGNYSPEHQNIEYKSSWRDEYLKWVSGFANAKGGILYFGIDDKGNVVGLNDYRKLLEDIPNKIIQQLGLVVDVNLHQKQDKYYIEMIVPISSVPISYHGIYHYRSGSTKQELKGIALQQFLLKKMGRTWDDLGLTASKIEDLDIEAVKFFLKKAIQSKRMPPESIDESLDDLASKLYFFNQEQELKNAFILLFGQNPQQYFAQAYFKIGKFGVDDSDLISQDTIVCPLIYMADRVMEVLRNKYLKSTIRYDGLQRIEELEYPEEALRESILNAIVHKDYTDTSIQLSIYNEHLQIWNPGTLPEDLSIAMLHLKHPSKPRNKNIAEVFFKAGYIEVWGRGIAKMIQSCKLAHFPEPIISETAGGIQVVFKKPEINLKVDLKTNLKTNLKNGGNLLTLMQQHPQITIPELSVALGKSKSSIKIYIQHLKQEGKIERVGAKKGGIWKVLDKKID